MIGRMIELWIRDIRWPPLQSVLANHDRPPLPVLYVLGHQRDPMGKYIRKNIHGHLIPTILRFVIDGPRPRIQRDSRLRQFTNYLRPKMIPQLLC